MILAATHHATLFPGSPLPKLLSAPPRPPPIDAVPSVSALSRRAFGRNPSARPAAIEWVNALGPVLTGIQHCQARWGHYYALSVQGCPWCRLMQQGAHDYFVTVVPLT